MDNSEGCLLMNKLEVKKGMVNCCNVYRIFCNRLNVDNIPYYNVDNYN